MARFKSAAIGEYECPHYQAVMFEERYGHKQMHLSTVNERFEPTLGV